jgi:outer membrane protein assembly factor BamB
VPKHGPRIRWGWKGVVGILLVSALVIGGGYLAVKNLLTKTEKELAAEADGFYDRKQFGAAADAYEKLAKQFDQSEHVPRYRFRRAISELRGAIGDNPEDTNALLQQVEDFLAEHKDHPELAPHAPDLAQSLVQLTEQFGQRTVANPAAQARPVMNRIRATAEAIKGIKKGKAFTKEQLAGIDKVLRDAEDAITRRELRDRYIARIKKAADGHPPFEAIKVVKEIAQEGDAELPGFARSEEVTALITALYDRHLGSVKFFEEPVRARADRAEEVEPGILFDPLLKGSPAAARAEDPVKLALVRGVLYWLNQSNGSVRWAVRLGADTTALPLRVPASAASAERILALSSDAETLTAYDTDANPLWRYRLSEPCLGQPVLWGRDEKRPERAYLATYDGRVHEIELAEGKRLGHYNLGQKLTLGGVREPGTARVYFPADDSCVYVIDVQKRRCQNILYSGHPAGSLRSVPLVVPGQSETAPGYLVLEQARGLHTVELRVFDLPITDRHAAARSLRDRPELAGWTWFPCSHDPEKVVLLTDAGVLGLFGIRQAQNNDQAVFPLLPGGGLRLDGLLGASGAFRGRAEIVQVQGDDLWVLAAGRLQRLRLAWGQKVGPQLVPGWRQPLELGSPLHASQVGDDPHTGRSTLYLVTQADGRQTCQATAVDDEDGTVRWQRQLGLVCKGDPLLLADPDGGEPLVLLQDQGGALFALDPTRFPHRPDVRWQVAGADIRLTGPLEDNPSQPPLLLPAPDGKSAYQVACPGAGNRLVVRHIRFAGPRRLRVTEESAPLESPLHGTPAVVGPRLILPLADGSVGRVPLPLPAELDSLETASDWRDARADANARGYVVALAGDRFLTTNGALGLTVWEWGANAKTFRSLPDGEEPTLTVKDRVVAAPLRLPGPAGGSVRVCVADSGGKLTLLAVQPNGALKEERSWDIGGSASADPFALVLPGGGLRVGCIVGGTRLVCVDPEADGLWSFDAKERIYRPHLAGGLLVLTDASGRYVGLDPRTGKRAGPGTQLRGSVAPATSPVPFGTDRLLAPLSDGTALLLSADRIRHPLLKLPLVW